MVRDTDDFICVSSSFLQIPGNLHGFNSRNETIKVPSREIIPPILLSDDRDSFGVQMYTITGEFLRLCTCADLFVVCG